MLHLLDAKLLVPNSMNSRLRPVNAWHRIVQALSQLILKFLNVSSWIEVVLKQQVVDLRDMQNMLI